MASVTVRVAPGWSFIKGDDHQIMERILGSIGTAKEVDKNPLHLKCRTSVPNMRRIKRVCPWAQLEKDTVTRAVIKDLGDKEDLWIHQTERLRAAKAGRSFSGYEFCFTPYKHQVTGFHFMHAAPRSAIFGDCGIGKTAIAASFLDSLVESGEITAKHPALIVCPISIIQHAWIEDLGKFTRSTEYASIYEPSQYKTKEKRLKRLAQEAHVFIASFSLLRLMTRELRKRKFSCIIVDESTKIKNATSRTFRALRDIAWKADRRYIMSGTPAPNGPIDLWSQFYFTDEGMTLEASMVDFRHEHFYSIDLGPNQQIWRPKRGMTSEIFRRTSERSVRFRASECLDLPETTYVVRGVDLPKKHRQAYDQMADNLFSELDDGESVTARIPIVKLMKLREITGGFVVNDKGEESEFDTNPKLNELDDLLEQILWDKGQKAIVWIQYKWEARKLLKTYGKKYGAVGLYGDISQSKKDANIDLFKNSPHCQLLIAHPQSAAHGLTLTVASYSIYYSLSHNFEEYYQSSKRIHRSGQKKPCFYYFLIANRTVDRALLGCLQDKKNVQDALIDGQVSTESILGIRQ